MILSGNPPPDDFGQTLLGQLTTSTTPLFGTQGGMREAVLYMLGLYSGMVLVVATFVVLYYGLIAIVDTAQTGKAFRRINPVWGPIRLIIAVGLLIPLPGAGGLNTGQMLVIKMSDWGSNLASSAWAVVTEKPEIMKAMVVEPMVPPATSLVRTLVMRDACRLITNMLAAQEQEEIARIKRELGAPPAATLKTVGPMPPLQNGDGSVTTAYGWPERPFFCGAVTTFPSQNADSEPMRAIKDAHLTGLGQLEKDAQNRAVELMEVMAGKPDAMGMSGVATMAADYEKNIRNVVKRVIDTRLDAMMQVDARQNGQFGWVGAGAALDQVLRLNLRLIALASSYPQIDPPDLFLTPPTNPNAADWKVYAQLRQIENVWGRVPTISPYTVAGLGGISTILGQAIATSESYGREGRVGQQLRSARDLLRLDDQDWKRLAQRPPLAAMAEFGTYLSGKSVALLAGAGILNATGMVAQPMVSVITFLGGLGFMVSLILLLFTPLIPFVRFVLGLAAWLLALFEAMVAMPLVALMHLKADEEGLAGRSGILCYILIIQVALRPVLMVFGLLGGLIVFLIMLSLLNQLFAVILTGLSGAGQIGSLWFVAASLVYAGLAVVMANACFKLIDWLPERTLTWLSGWVEMAGQGPARTPGP